MKLQDKCGEIRFNSLLKPYSLFSFLSVLRISRLEYNSYSFSAEDALITEKYSGNNCVSYPSQNPAMSLE